MKEMFKDFIVHSDADDIACVEIIQIIKNLDTVNASFYPLIFCIFQAKQESAVDSMVKFFQTSHSHLIPLDRIITKVFFALYEQKIMPIL
jgi:hypothetical protein